MNADPPGGEKHAERVGRRWLNGCIDSPNFINSECLWQTECQQGEFEEDNLNSKEGCVRKQYFVRPYVHKSPSKKNSQVIVFNFQFPAAVFPRPAFYL
jgi:hypothetical protein